MTTVLEVPLQSFKPALLRGLREKFPGAFVRIQTEELAMPTNMDEPGFWKIMDQFDWKKSDNQAIAAPAIQALSQFSSAEIARFDDLLAEKLHALDGKTFALHSGKNWDGEHFSPDEFLYARCCAVANGRQFFEKLLANPALMPKNLTFEPLLYLASKAWKMKTGEPNYSHVPGTWVETYSNPNGWPGMETPQARISNGL